MFIDTSAWEIGQELPTNFSVKSRHPKYEEMLPYWQKCRDARKGSKAIKNGSNCETYLPRLDSQVISDENGKTTGQKNREYRNYKDRAIWFGGTGKTVRAFLGMIFSDQPILQSQSAELQNLLTDHELVRYATQDDESFSSLMESASDEVLTVNRVGILEDFPVQLNDEGEPVQMSRKEYEEKKITSYSVMYKAEQITNWGIATRNGKRIESFYVLEETWLDGSESYTNPEKRLRWRILLLEEQSDRSLKYKQVIVKESKNDKGLIVETVEDMFYPVINDKNFDIIPFWCLSTTGNNTDDVKEPEILDLVEMNIGHYRNSADLENEKHYVSIKTAVFPGWPVDDPNYGSPVLGGALATPDGTNQPFILEATNGSGLEVDMKEKKENMAILGAQMLASKGRYIQSATTSEIENQGQSGILGNLSATIEDFFSIILTLKIKWSLGREEGASVVLNKEYMKNTLSIEALTPLVQALQSGKMSFDMFYYNMSKLDMYPDDWTKEDEKNAIDSDGLGMASQDILTALDTANKRIAALEGKGLTGGAVPGKVGTQTTTQSAKGTAA